MAHGKLVLISGPTGSGKGVLVEHIKETYDDIVFPISCTTRLMRPTEHEGENYHFLTEAEFKQRLEAGEFLEWAQYGGNYYGTLRSEVVPMLDAGRLIVREVEVQGARQIIRALKGNELTTIYIDAGSWEELEKRVRARAPITEEELVERKKRYEDELSYKDTATAVVLNPNGGLEQAKKDILFEIEKVRKEIGLP